MLNDIEKKLLERQAALEARSKEKWFANSPVTCNTKKWGTQDRPVNSTTMKTRIDTKGNEVRGYPNIFSFLLVNFDKIRELIPWRPEVPHEIRAEKKEALVLDFKNNVRFNRTMNDTEIWVRIDREFNKQYWRLQKEKKEA